MFPYSFDLKTLNGTNGFTISTTREYISGFGYSVSGIGDINNDGFKDFIVGDYIANPCAYVIFGRKDFDARIIVQNIQMPYGLSLYCDHYSGGQTLAGLGDINNDGFADFAVGAPGFGNDINKGKVYVVFGQQNFSSSFDLTKLNGINGFSINGAYNSDRAGVSPSPTPSASTSPSHSAKPSASSIPSHSISPTPSATHHSASPAPTMTHSPGPSTPSHYSVSPSPSNVARNNHDDDATELAGGIAGGVIGLAALGFAGWWCYKNNLHTDGFGESAHLVGERVEANYGSHTGG